MNDGEKALTYEEAKQLCMKAFDGGTLYGSESMRYGVNATAYDWDHWLKKNERMFMPEPTVEDVLHELIGKAQALSCVDEEDKLVADFAKRLTLEGDAE